MERWDRIFLEDFDRPRPRRRRGPTIRRLMKWVAAAAIVLAVIHKFDQLPYLTKAIVLIVVGFPTALLLIIATPIWLMRRIAAMVETHRRPGRRRAASDPADRSWSEIVRGLGPPMGRPPGSDARKPVSLPPGGPGEAG